MRSFLLTYLVFWCLGLLGLALWGYEQSFLFLNRLHNPLLDLIMPHLTHLGDGVIVTTFFAFLILPRNNSLVVTLLITMIGVSLVTVITKNYLFSDWDRPLAVFEGRASFHYIATVALKRHAFPSGHSMAAAAMFTIIAFHIGSVPWYRGTLLGLFSILIAYSRLYIGVHFLGDVLVGTLLGALLASLALGLVYPKLLRHLDAWSPGTNRKVNTGLGMLLLIMLFLGLYQLLTRHYL